MVNAAPICRQLMIPNVSLQLAGNISHKLPESNSSHYTGKHIPQNKVRSPRKQKLTSPPTKTVMPNGIALICSGYFSGNGLWTEM